MPKKPKELSAIEVKRLTTPGLHAVGGVAGLYLRVYESGARCWVLRYATPEVRQSQKGNSYSARRDLGLGGYPEVSLARAREKASEHREQIRDGIDPAVERKKARAAWAESLRRGITFERAARKAYAAKAPEFKNAKHSRTWIQRLEKYAFPSIGHVPVADLDVNHVLSVLEPIWLEKTETASRVRMRMESVLTWATVSGYRSGDNPARWKDNLKELLPKPAKVRRTEHYPALPWRRVPDFMAELRAREGSAARALHFLILTWARSGEVRFAEWREIDLDGHVWTVPAEKAKNGLPHRVPLSEDAAALLDAQPRFQGGDLVFPAPRGGTMSDMSMAAVVRRMHKSASGTGWIDPATDRVITPHGFRSSAKDWARNRTAYPDEVSELALAHVNSDATRAAYARDELLPQRSRLMADWAQFCRTVEPQADVLPMRHAGGDDGR